MENKREQMVGTIKNKYGLDFSGVLLAMLQVPRHKFAPKDKSVLAYQDSPVPIGFGQTMSQPYTVAFMTKLITEALNPKHEILNKSKFIKSKIPKKAKKYGKVLEIGTGSGYQAAVLSKFFKQVYTIEIVPQLAKRAKKKLKELGYKNVHVRKGSGEWGWKGRALFDAIMITAGVKKVPDELFDQLKVGGVLVAPVGRGNDKVMTRFRKTSARQARTQKTSEKQIHPQKTLARQARSKKTSGKQARSKKTSARQAKLKKEEFGIFHFVPFVKEG